MEAVAITIVGRREPPVMSYELSELSVDARLESDDVTMMNYDILFRSSSKKVEF
jgi:hypothetical protein